jgi:Fungal protein kinase
VLHRAISSGNVLFADQVDYGGFLHDLDYSEIVLMPGDNVEYDLVEQISRRLKDMTVSSIYYLCDGFKRFLAKGTYQFMAVDVLMHKMHEHKHDLESIYWLLIWIILRHVDHNQGPFGYSKLFDVENRELAAAQKEYWLRHSELRIIRNEPLPRLLNSLRILFNKQLADIDTASVEVTYNTLLATIDNALCLPDWPENDGCLAFSPYSRSKCAKDASRASSKKRKTESRTASTSSKRQRTSTSPSSSHS